MPSCSNLLGAALSVKPLLPVTFFALLSTVASCAIGIDDLSRAHIVRVPMEIVNRTPVVAVRVNDIDVRLLLDTGSGTTLSLYPSILDQLDAVPTGETLESIGIEGVTMHEALYVVESIEIGDTAFENVRIGQDDHTEEHRSETIQYRGTYGIVGRGLFKDYKLIIDYQDQTITLIPPNASSAENDACEGIELSLVTDKDLGLTTLVTTDIGDIFAVWDTGARGNVLMKAASDAAGLSLKAYDHFETETFIINGYDFGPIRMNVWGFPAPADLDTILGYWFFSDKIVCVDFPGQRIYVRT